MNRKVVIASAGAATLVALQVASKAVRDALFLQEFGAVELPKAVIASAILSLISVAIVAALVARFGPRRATSFLLIVSAVSLVGEYSLLQSAPPIGVALFYLHTAALGALVISGIWSAISECFDPNTARKNIGTIAAFATAGGLAGGLLAERIATWFSPQDTLIVISIGHALSALLVWNLTPLKRTATIEKATESMLEILKNPYVRNLALVVVFATATGNVLDYVLKFTADETLADADLVRFFGAYYTITGLITFVGQIAITGRIMNRLGVARTAWSLPAIGAFGSVLVIVFPTLASAAFARGAEAVTRNSTFRSSYELLFSPLAPSVRRRIKTWIDVGADRLGDLIGGALVAIVLLLVSEPTVFLFGVLSLTLSVALLSVVSQLRDRYQNALAGALEGDSETLLAQTFAGFGGSEISMFTQTMFTSEKPFVFTFELSDEPTESNDAFDDVLEDLARERVSPKTLEAVRNEVRDNPQRICDLLLEDDTEFALRKRLPKLLINGDETIVVPALMASLKDKRFEVRFQAARALFLLQKRGVEIDDDSRIEEVVRKELRVHKNIWDARASNESEPDEESRLQSNKENRSVEHLFHLLALQHDPEQLQRALRGLNSDDALLRGTAIEFIDSVLPNDIVRRLSLLLEL